MVIVASVVVNLVAVVVDAVVIVGIALIARIA